MTKAIVRNYLKHICIFILTIIIGCSERKSVKILSSAEMIDRTFLLAKSLSAGIKNIDTLTQSLSYYENDTLIILIGDYKKTNFSLRIEISGNSYNACTQFSSDYPQYDGKYHKKYEANLTEFLLSESNLNVGDTISGKIVTQELSVNAQDYIESISFKGRFIAIID